MDEAVSQTGSLVIGAMAALAVLGAVMVLLGGSDLGILRSYVAFLLEAAC